MKPGGPGGPGSLPPFSEEWFRETKKLLKQSGIEKATAASGAPDVYEPSEAAKSLPAPQTPQEKFLNEVANDILQMDPQSETFVPDATGRLVDSALAQEFGSHLAKSPAYPQMKDRITATILQDPSHREIVEDFLGALFNHHHAASQPGGEETPPQG